MSKLLTLHATVLTAYLLLGAIGCESNPAPPVDDESQGDSSDSESLAEPVVLTPVPPPPGVPAPLLEPPAGDLAERAQYSILAVVDQLSPPPHLQSSVASSTNVTDADRPPSNPPLAAQKFYAAGRQSLLDGDNFGAVQAFEKALRLTPENPAILQSLGEAWARAGNRVSAANSLRQAYTADPTDLLSLYMLGRFALEDRRLDHAILNLHRALELARSGDHPDPSARRLIQFYLANTLNQAGYTAAAVESFRAYFDMQRDDSSATPTRFARELTLINSQQGETLMMLGDAQHRLLDPEAAALVYRLAGRMGVLNADALQLRVLYTRLRLGQSCAAQEVLAQLLTQPTASSAGAPDTRTLALIRYAIEQGLPADQLIARLTTMYQRRDRPAALALALADVMPPGEARKLLRTHLQQRPADTAVFGRWLSLEFASADQPAAYRRAIDATVTAMADAPPYADPYADQLFARIEHPSDLLAALGDSSEMALTADDPLAPTRAAMRSILRGRAYVADQQLAPARLAFERGLESAPGNADILLHLAALEVQSQDYAAAQRWLDRLPPSASDTTKALLLKAEALDATDQTDAALRLIEQALRNESPGSPLMLIQADLQLKQGDTAAAERTLLDALNARPSEPIIYEKLLAIYEADGTMQQNYQRLRRRMIETIPDAPITKLVKAQTLVAMRNYPEAQRVLESLDDAEMQRSRYGLEVLQLRMEVYVGTQQGEKVNQLLQQHLKDAGDQPDDTVLGLAARHYQRSGDQDRYFEIEEIRWKNRPPGIQRSAVLGAGLS